MTQRIDLLVLVADRDIEAAVRGILARQKALGIRNISVDLRRHPRKDAGCCKEGVEFLRAFVRQYNRAMLIFDHEGCGQQKSSASELENDLESRLQSAGWKNGVCVIVLDPELEVWVWSDSPHVDEK